MEQKAKWDGLSINDMPSELVEALAIRMMPVVGSKSVERYYEIVNKYKDMYPNWFSKEDIAKATNYGK